MMAAYLGQFRRSPECVVEVHRASAGDEKNMADTLLNELLSDVIRESYHLLREHFTSGPSKKGQSRLQHGAYFHSGRVKNPGANAGALRKKTLLL